MEGDGGGGGGGGEKKKKKNKKNKNKNKNKKKKKNKKRTRRKEKQTSCSDIICHCWKFAFLFSFITLKSWTGQRKSQSTHHDSATIRHVIKATTFCPFTDLNVRISVDTLNSSRARQLSIKAGVIWRFLLISSAMSPQIRCGPHIRQSTPLGVVPILLVCHCHFPWQSPACAAHDNFFRWVQKAGEEE